VPRLRRPWSFRRQIVVLTAAITTVAMLLLTLVLQLVLARITTNDVDRALEDGAEAVITAIKASSADGSITVPDALLLPGVAVFGDGRELVAGSKPPSARRSYDELAASTRAVVREADGHTRVRAQPFTTSDGTRGVVVVSERLDPYEEAERLALLVSLLTGGLAVAAIAATAAWAVRRALRPVAEMAATASDWSEHQLGGRFALGPPSNEISALAATLDTLLDKVSSAIRSEQRLTAELAHELRTPLTSIHGTADLLLLRDGPALTDRARDDLREISAASRRMATTVTTLLDLARTETSVPAAATCGLAEVVEEAVAHAHGNGVRTRIEVHDVRLGLPHALAVRTVSPVVDNAVHFARSRVSVTSTVVDSSLELLVADDGPGVGAAPAEELFEPGRTSGSSGGAGLGLALSRRIARTAGGDVHLAAATGTPGGRFVVRLPLA
jgi:signal transduction histidine kinase